MKVKKYERKALFGERFVCVSKHPRIGLFLIENYGEFSVKHYLLMCVLASFFAQFSKNW